MTDAKTHVGVCHSCRVPSFSRGTSPDGREMYAVDLRCLDDMNVGARGPSFRRQEPLTQQREQCPSSRPLRCARVFFSSDARVTSGRLAGGPYESRRRRPSQPSERAQTRRATRSCQLMRAPASRP